VINAELRWVVPVCAALLLAVPMSATPLVVGGVIFTSDDTGAPTGTILVSILNAPYSTPALNGTYSAWVVRNGGGTLDFYYQLFFNPASPDPIGRVTMFNFGALGFTAVDVVSRWDGDAVFGAGALNGDELPLFADRTATTVGFNYKVVPGLCTCERFPPSSTTILGIKTNATDYAAGILNIIDGSVATVPAFAPIAVPEPGARAILGAGLLGLAMLRRERA
jgi:hypothetical protein